MQLMCAVSALFFGLMQPENLTNSFRFTSQDAKILLTYYTVGVALGCIFCPSIIESSGSTWKTLWILNLVFWLSSAIMLFFIADEQVNIVLTCICQVAIGASIMGSVIANLKRMGEEMTKKTMSEKNAYLACTIGFAGFGAAILCFLADYLYYLNRNALIWAYLESSAFPGGFLLINAILHHLSSKCFPVTFSIRLDSTQSRSTSSASQKK